MRALVAHPPHAAGELMLDVWQHRTMIDAVVDDGQTLTALNEVSVGHRSHQSAHYTIAAPGAPFTWCAEDPYRAGGAGPTAPRPTRSCRARPRRAGWRPSR